MSDLDELAAKRSYHDLHITTAKIPRTSIANLGFNYDVMCCRTAGWQLWLHNQGPSENEDRLVAGEYEEPDNWLVLDVGGHIIVDSRGQVAEPDEP